MNLERKNSAATTTTHDVLTHHLNSFGVGDIVGTMADYTAESKFFTSEGLLRGPEAISGPSEPVAGVVRSARPVQC
jgi:hypothetical protein